MAETPDFQETMTVYSSSSTAPSSATIDSHSQDPQPIDAVRNLIPDLHIDEQALLKDHTSENTQARPNAAYKAPSLKDIPRDIIVLIFEDLLDRPASVVALGLTCTSFYNLMKTFFPDPIYPSPGLLFNQWDEGFWHHEIKGVIGEFLGPDYRPTMCGCVPFLRRSVYGDSFTIAEVQLRDRYYNWLSFLHLGGENEEHILPRPFGIGNDWYKEVYAVFKTLDHKGELRHRWKKVIDYSIVFQEIVDEEVLEEVLTAFSEWIEMIGL